MRIWDAWLYVSYFIVFPMHGKQLPNGLPGTRIGRVVAKSYQLAPFPFAILFYQEIFALCSYARILATIALYALHFGYSTWGLFQTCPAKALHPVMEASDFRFLYSQMEITVVRARQAKQ
ncbi:hypothetical protein ACJX0J_001022 (mitochondrion) [Zea mays]